MRYINFKNCKISALGLGGLRFPEVSGAPDCIDRKEGEKVIDAAVSCGINYFDTSHTYQNGDSERFLGEALSRYPRDSYYLASKFYVDYSDNIEAAFEEQLKRCRTDYFDVYLLHCLDEGTIEPYMDKKADYLGYLLKQKQAGRIRNIGFSSHAAPETLAHFLEWYDEFDMALIQLNYLDWRMLDGKRQYEILTDHKIPIWVMEPLKGGILSKLNDETAAILKKAAPERSLSEWSFRFLQGLPNVQVVLSGMSSTSQIAENSGIFDTFEPLEKRELEILKSAADRFVEDMGIPCSSCRYCCSACPAELDIPLLIKGYNEGTISGSAWKIASLCSTKSAAECLGCGACLGKCPQNINIPEMMKRIASLPLTEEESQA